jgi:hypothetical protein
MDIKEWAQQWVVRELEDVKRVPLTLVLVLGVGLTIGWVAAGTFYGERMTFLQLQVDSATKNAATAPAAPPPVDPAVSAPRLSLRFVGLFGVVGALLVWSAIRNGRRMRAMRLDLDA